MDGYKPCREGTYSPEEIVSVCVSCPAGKTVASGVGSSESDCSWSKSGYFIIYVIITIKN